MEKSKKIETDIDKLKVIALTNLLENVQEMTDNKRIELTKSLSESIKTISKIKGYSSK